MVPLCLQEEEIHEKSMAKECKASKYELWHNMSARKLQKLRFCRNSDLKRQGTEAAAVRRYSGIKSLENTCGGVLL